MMLPTRAHLIDLIGSIRLAMRNALNAGHMKGADELRDELVWYQVLLQRGAERSFL